MLIRRFRAEDGAGCAALFYEAVHVGAAEKYDAAQRRAWAPKVPDGAAFAERLGAEHCFVAEDGEAIRGFMSLTPKGYLDMAFVAPDARGTGLADKLYAEILRAARSTGLTYLAVDASAYAHPFFTRHGWTIHRAAEVERGGLAIPRYSMFLDLSG
ncbi:MAG: GNAT family N-acetyltransferase [Pseudomonadota bacterium]